jgi:hypothetical protein
MREIVVQDSATGELIYRGPLDGWTPCPADTEVENALELARAGGVGIVRGVIVRMVGCEQPELPNIGRARGVLLSLQCSTCMRLLKKQEGLNDPGNWNGTSARCVWCLKQDLELHGKVVEGLPSRP